MGSIASIDKSTVRWQTVDLVPSSHKERASNRDVRAGEGVHGAFLVQERLLSIWEPIASDAEHG